MECYHGHVKVLRLPCVTSVADLAFRSVLQEAGVVAPSEGNVKLEQFLNMDVVTLVEV
jgi:hypothetical protein